MFGTYRTKQLGRLGALIMSGSGTRALPGPTIGELILLADPHLVLEPDLYRCARRELGADFRHTYGSTAGIGPSSTSRTRNALCVLPSLGGTPGEGMLMRPSGPCLLNRITQSRNASDGPCHQSWLQLPAKRRAAAASRRPIAAKKVSSLWHLPPRPN